MNGSKKVFLLFFFMCTGALQATVIGSNSAVSRQARAFFKRFSSAKNRMQGFSIFKKGVVLENPDTEVSFDAFFPISGDVVLNGGTLSLLGDLEFKNPFRIGVGSIFGNSFSLEMPRNTSYLDFPSLYYVKLIVNLMDEVYVGQKVYSVDWSYDDQYLALGLRGSNGTSELKIYEFDGAAISEVASEDFGNASLNSVRWQPSSYYLATAASSGTEFKTWLFTSGSNTLQEVGSANIGATNAVAWSPNGNYIAVGRSKDTTLRVYPVTNGSLGTVITATFGSSVTVSNNALDWHSDGDRLAVGLQWSSQAEVQVFAFNGSDLTIEGGLQVTPHVLAVSWKPNSSLLTIGRSGGSDRLKIYSYSAGTFSEVTKANVGMLTSVYGLDWDPDGVYLGVSKGYASQGYELEVYYFDTQDDSLHLVSGYSSDAASRDVSWAHSGAYLANGDDGRSCYLYDFAERPFVFKDLKIYFGSEVRSHASIHFQGDCVINGNGNILQLSPTTSLVVEPGATLCLEDMTIKGISGGNIQCMSDTSAIHMRDVQWVQDGDFTFTLGSLEFSNDIEMSGNAVFAYQSVQTSTLASKSTLTLSPRFTFSYDPLDGVSKDLFAFEDTTSLLNLDGATVCTGPSGIDFVMGKLQVSRDSFFQTDDINGISIGNRTSSSDLVCDVLSGAVLQLSSGVLNYKNTQAGSWNMISERAWLQMMDGTFLRLYEDLDLDLGMLQARGTVVLSRLLGKNITGTVITTGRLMKEYISENA